MTKRQQIDKSPPEAESRAEDVDAELGAFIADVLELAGLLRRTAQDIAGQAGQTQSVWYALSVFSDGPWTVSQASRRLGTTRQAVQRTTNELLTAGLALAEPNPDHRTAPLIRLTPEGERVLARISEAAMVARRRWFADADAPALARAHVEIRRLRDALREVAG